MTKIQTKIYKFIEKQYEKDSKKSLNKSQAAKQIGISRQHLDNQLKLMVALGYLEEQASLIPV